MDDKLVILLRDLHTARLKAEAARTSKNGILEAVQATDAYKEAIKCAALYATEAENIGKEIELLCLPQFAVDANKHPHDAITIKEFDIVTIPKELEARDWCLTNFTPALKLDIKTFERAAKNGDVPAELASITKEARVQIASDLTKYLT